MAEIELGLTPIDKDLCYSLGNLYLSLVLTQGGDLPLECLKKIGICQGYFSASGYAPPIGWTKVSQLRETLEAYNRSY